MKDIVINSKGITIVSLIVIIIVLLILAGISVGVLTNGNGITEQAHNANEELRILQIQEAANTWERAAEINGSGKTYNEYLEFIQNLINENVLGSNEFDKESSEIIINNETVYMFDGIVITSVEVESLENGTTEIEKATFDDRISNIQVYLPQESSIFSYKVVITNFTNKTYMLEEIKELTDSLGLEYEIENFSIGDRIQPGQVKEFIIRYRGGERLTNTNFEVNLEYILAIAPIYEEGILNGSIPNMTEGMIPVVYDERDEEWEIANIYDIWYRYEERQWANAVTVVAEKRDSYLNAKSGTVVKMEDINSMYVWIPRFSYTIKNVYGEAGFGNSVADISTPGEFNIKFESVDDIETGSAVYTSLSPSNYYTPSAFAWGETIDNIETRIEDSDNQEISGFWIGKFEPAAEQPLANIEQQIVIKPNVTSWRIANMGTFHKSILKYMNGENGYNIYGFNGEYNNHMIKNTEWGAVAILSQSEYGKYGDSRYTGEYKEVYSNPSYITGKSAGDANKLYNIYEYNDLEIIGDTQGEAGPGASTTGNITGVYDMNGSAWEYVMGIMYKSGNQEVNCVTSTSQLESVPKDLVNAYMYNTQNHILGDATIQTKHFYGDMNFFIAPTYPIFLRGGDKDEWDNSGVFAYSNGNGRATDSYTTRVVLVNDI